MSAAGFLNRVYQNTATTGTGTITLGSAVSGNMLTALQAGGVDGTVYSYVIEEGSDMEVGTGTLGGTGTTLTRTCTISKIGGTVGTTKMTLAGAAKVRIIAAAEDMARLVSGSTLILKQSSAPTPTAEGDIQWDTDDDRIVVGNGATTKVFSDDVAQQAALKTYFDTLYPVLTDIASQADQETGSSTSKLVTSGRQQSHPSAAKAWVNFNGTGTVAIRVSYNTTSITDNGVGDYTWNIGTDFSGADYVAVGSAAVSTGSVAFLYGPFGATPTGGAYRMVAASAATPTTPADVAYAQLVAFGDQ